MPTRQKTATEKTSKQSVSLSTRLPTQAVRLTKRYIDMVKPPLKGQTFVRDTELKGFGLRITATGAKAFVLEKRINGRNRRQTIARYPDMTVEAARNEALILLGKIAKGIDPVAEQKSIKAKQISVAEVFNEFKRIRGKNMAERTLYDYERFLEKGLTKWLSRPLIEIDREHVLKRFSQLTRDSGPAYANSVMRVLRALINFARERYDDPGGDPLFIDNPVDVLTRTRSWNKIKRRQTVIRPDDLSAWYEAVEKLRTDAPDDAQRADEVMADFLLYLLFTGSRRKEAATLRWEWVDFRSQTITYPNTKNGKTFVFPMSDYIQTLLERRHAHRWNSFVFPGTGATGHLIEPKRAIAKIKTWSGVSFTAHDLRRTFISTAAGLRLSPYYIKGLVNHSMNNDVTEGYVITHAEDMRRPLKEITHKLKGLCFKGTDHNVVELNSRFKG